MRGVFGESPSRHLRKISQNIWMFLQNFSTTNQRTDRRRVKVRLPTCPRVVFWLAAGLVCYKLVYSFYDFIWKALMDTLRADTCFSLCDLFFGFCLWIELQLRRSGLRFLFLYLLTDKSKTTSTPTILCWRHHSCFKRRTFPVRDRGVVFFVLILQSGLHSSFTASLSVERVPSKCALKRPRSGSRMWNPKRSDDRGETCFTLFWSLN